MSGNLALDTLLTALACLLPANNGPIDLMQHESFIVENPKSFCDSYEILDRGLTDIQLRIFQSEHNLLKLQYDLKNITAIQRGHIPFNLPKDCTDLDYGVHELKTLDGKQTFFTVCEDSILTGGWMLILNKTENDFRTSSERINGYGEVYEDFFIGFKKVSDLIAAEKQEIVISALKSNYETCFALYTDFVISSKNFVLRNTGNCRGTCCEILSVKRTPNWWDLSTKDFIIIKMYIRNKVTTEE